MPALSAAKLTPFCAQSLSRISRWAGGWFLCPQWPPPASPACDSKGGAERWARAPREGCCGDASGAGAGPSGTAPCGRGADRPATTPQSAGGRGPARQDPRRGRAPPRGSGERRSAPALRASASLGRPVGGRQSAPRGAEAGPSHPGALPGGEPRGPRPPPPPGPAGSQAPRTCERGGAVGVADVAVRRVDLLGVEDEDPEHGGADPWLAAPSSPRSPPRPGCPRGSACAPRTRSPPAAAALAASAELQLSAQAADSRDDTALCTWRRPAGGRARTVRASLRGGAGRGGGLGPPLTLHLPRSAEPSRPPPPAAGTRALPAEPAAPPRAGRGTRAPAGGQALGRAFPRGGHRLRNLIDKNRWLA